MGQESPCEDISLGSCLVEPGSIINTLSFPPDKCARFCQLDNNCEFWRARWDGTQCHLLSSIPDICPFFSTDKIFASIFSTPKRVKRDKTDFATKQRKSHKRKILQQNSIKCDKTSKIVHSICFVHNILT